MTKDDLHVEIARLRIEARCLRAENTCLRSLLTSLGDAMRDLAQTGADSIAAIDTSPSLTELHDAIGTKP